MAERRTPDLVLEDCRIVFRNFSGNETQYNRAGDRNFCVLIEPEKVEALLDSGWPIKYLRPRPDADEYDVPQPYMQVKVAFGKQPPRIIMITNRGKTHIDEKSVSNFDFADIINVDLILRAYNWEVGGKTGVKPYLKSAYITIEEDPLEAKYVDTPSSAIDGFDYVREYDD